MTNVLLVRPDYDTFTSRVNPWGQYVVNIAGTAGHYLRDLSAANAIRSNVENELQQLTDCVVFYGHGVHDGLIEHGGGSSAIDTTNDNLLRGKLIYAVACDAARSLGPSAVSRGATAFVGYNDLFGTVKGPPLSYFRQAANAAILYLLDQRQRPIPSCSIAIALAKREYDNGIDFWARGGGAGQRNYALTAAWLRWNRDSLVLSGDPNATL